MTPKEKNPMSNRIEEGDRVKVDFTPRNETTQPYFYGTVLHTPSDVGDMWHLKDDDGVIIYVNPSCSTLETIIRMDTHE